MRALAAGSRRVAAVSRVWRRWSATSSGTGPDDFDSFGFDDEDELLAKDVRDAKDARERSAMEAEQRLREAAEDASKLTPAMAREMVDQMVDSIKRSATRGKPWEEKEVVNLTLDSDSLPILAAARFESHRVHAAGRKFMENGQYPIESKVTAFLKVDNLGLSQPAKAALLKIVEYPPRYQPATGEIKITAKHHVLAVENKIYLTNTMSRLVREARISVGEISADQAHSGNLLETWKEVVNGVDKIQSEQEVTDYLSRELDLIARDQRIVAAEKEAEAALLASGHSPPDSAPPNQQLSQ